MQTLRAPPTQLPTQRATHVSNALASHIFIQHDAVKKPLQKPYDGPYSVLKRDNKFYTVDLNTRQDTVSFDRFKPAYLDSHTLFLP